jgi:hypothetical protein
MTWIKITVSNTAADAGEYDRIQNLFGDTFMAAGGPDGAALFTNSLIDARKTGVCIFYFSPDAAKIFAANLQSLDGEKCEAPTLTEKPILLVGAGDAFKLLA